jgi:hypothetical protein
VGFQSFADNINEKGARLYCLAEEKVVILIKIKIYVGIPENRILIIIIESISINGKSLSPIIIIPGKIIIAI